MRDRLRASGTTASVLVTAVLVGFTIVTLFPIAMSVLNSLKTQGDMMNNILSVPARPELGNYAKAWRDMHYPRSLLNTAVVVAIGLAGIILFGSMAGYKLSRTRGRLSSVLFGLFVMSMLIPFHSMMISLTKTATDLRLQGSTPGLGLVYIGLGVSMAVFLYHGFVKSVPRELEEAAVMDGCGRLRLFFSIVFPLLAPVTATIAIINALWMWNDFLLPLLMLTDSSHYTLLLSTTMMFGQYGNNDWSGILAALVMAMLPAVAVYLAMQKQIASGITEGALKG